MTKRQQPSGLPWMLLMIGIIVGTVAFGLPGTFLIGPALFPKTVSLTTTATVSKFTIITVPTLQTVTVPGPVIVNTVIVTTTAAAPYYQYPYTYPYQSYQTGTLYLTITYSGSGPLSVTIRDLNDQYAQPIRRRVSTYAANLWTATFSGLTIGHYYQVTVYPVGYQTTVLLSQAYQSLSLP
jgi:hypothetical protein